MKPRKRHWYHCTDQWRGRVWSARRIRPANCAAGEPATPRLCVASSVARCFAARLFGGKDVYVYRTRTPRAAVPPVGVSDAPITREMWLVPPVGLELTHVIPAAVVDRAAGATRRMVLERWFSGAFTPVTPLERLRGFQDAIDALGDEFCDPIDRSFVRRAMALFEAKGTT